MLLKYGSYSHPENEVEVLFSADVLRGEFGQRIGEHWTWTINGRLSGSTQAEITTAIASLENAHATDGGDLLLYTDSGTTLSRHFQYSSSSRGGVKVARLSYPDGRGAEYSTYRNYQVVYEYDVLSTQGGLVSYQQAIEEIGGGPRIEYVHTVVGAPVKVMVGQQTTFKGTQSGSAVGVGSWPVFPQPMWPAHEHRDRRRQLRADAQYDNTGQYSFPISWNYEFESSGPLGLPPMRPPV